MQSGSAYICQVAAVVDGGKVARSALVTAEVPYAFMVTPLGRDVLSTAGAEQVAVTTAPGCAWTAASESGFLAGDERHDGHRARHGELHGSTPTATTDGATSGSRPRRLRRSLR